MVFQLEPVAVLSLAVLRLGSILFLSYFHLECCVLSFPLLVVDFLFCRVELRRDRKSAKALDLSASLLSDSVLSVPPLPGVGMGATACTG